MAEKESIIVSERNEKYSEFGDSEPNDKLKKAADRYKAIMTSSETIETTKLSKTRIF